jgi:hypothetical protein
MGSKLGVVLEAVTPGLTCLPAVGLARCRGPEFLFGSFSSSAVFLPAEPSPSTAVEPEPEEGAASGGTNTAPEGSYSAARGAGTGPERLPAWAPSFLPVVATAA